MSTISGAVSNENGLSAFIRSHQLTSYFILAFLGAWLVFIPLNLAQNGFGVLPFSLPLTPLLALATFTGPTFATLVMVGITDGHSGIKSLFQRYTFRRVGLFWLFVALFGPLMAFLTTSIIELRSVSIAATQQIIVTILSLYPVYIVLGLITGPLGEEVGWRGFALPKLQEKMGPVWGSLCLGVLWAAWHFPLFFLPAWSGGLSVSLLALAYFTWVIPFTVIMTWVYNNTRGNLLIMTLLHAAENAAVTLIALQLIVIRPTDLFFQLKAYGLLALFLIVITRGKLGYQSEISTM